MAVGMAGVAHDAKNACGDANDADTEAGVDSSSSTSSSEDDGGLFFGPMAESAVDKRIKWRRLLGEGVPFFAGQRRVPRKRRKIEEQPRYGRYSYVFSEGDDRRFRLDPSKSPWWDLLNDPSVGDESSAAGRKFRFKFRLPYGMAMALVSEAQPNPAWRDKPSGTGHGRGPARHPLVLKVLAALRHLAEVGDDEWGGGDAAESEDAEAGGAEMEDGEDVWQVPSEDESD